MKDKNAPASQDVLEGSSGEIFVVDPRTLFPGDMILSTASGLIAGFSEPAPQAFSAVQCYPNNPHVAAPAGLSGDVFFKRL